MPGEKKDVGKVVKDSYSKAKKGMEKQVVEAEKVLKEKGLELRDYLKQIKAVLEEWKFSLEETKEGMRIELRAVALIKYPKRK